MKRILAFVLIFVLLMSTACSKPEDDENDVSIDENVQAEQSNDKIVDEKKQVIDDTKPLSENQTEQKQEPIGDNETKKTTPDKQEKEPENIDITTSDSKKEKEFIKSNFEYTISENGDIVISKYIGTEVDVIVPSKIDNKAVKIIGICSFAGREIKSIVIPDTVTAIFGLAFLNCSKLSTIDFKKGVTYIAYKAFEGCTSLKTVVLPEGLEDIDSKAFNGCVAQEQVTIPASMKNFSTSIFNNCKNLKNVIFSDGIKEIIGIDIFSYCSSLESIVIPSSVTTISARAFVCVELKAVYFEGDAPLIVGEYLTIGDPYSSEMQTIYYKEGTKGWDTTLLKQYNLSVY